MPNPFRNWIVGNAWESGEADVADIGRAAFEACLKAIESTANQHRTTSVLLYGEPGSGKTHLMRRIRSHLAAPGPAQDPRAIFVYIRLSTSPNMIWRHIRRRLADDLLRPISAGANGAVILGAGRSQLHSLLMRRLAMPGSHGVLLDSWKRAVAGGAPLDSPAFAVALDTILGRVDPAALARLEIFDSLDGEHEIPWPLRQILRHMTHRRHPEITAAWLRGDSLPEEHLARMGIGVELESTGDDAESRAQRIVLALARFAADWPIVLCLDQLEALDTNPADQTGFAALARAISTLHDETANLVLISCVQTSYRDVLRRFQSDFARISEFEGHLPPLDRNQAARLLQSRRGPSNGASVLWPFDEIDLVGLFDQAGLANARRILSEAAKKFDRLVPAPETCRDLLESEWRRRLDEASRALPVTDVDEILNHGLQSLVRIKGGGWLVKPGSDNVELVLHGPSAAVEISLCNQVSMHSLAFRLKRLAAYQEEHLQTRVVILRDARLPISPGAKAVRDHLDALDFAGGRLIHPSVEALTALEALRRLLADANSGDLTIEGHEIHTDAVTEWLEHRLPPSLEKLLEEIAR